jgi:antitoxin component YwqK of YwqJK toxin-antitoxin module
MGCQLLKRFLLSVIIICPLLLSAQPADTNKVDVNGKKQGYWKKFVSDTLKYEGTFKDDIPTGEFKYYYPSRALKSVVQYSEKALWAKTVLYYENGKKMAEGDYWNRKKHGPWKYYNESEILTKEEDFDYGVEDGKWIVYYDNGKPVEIKTYSKGKLQGELIRFYPDSVVSFKGTYANDKLNGTVYHYYLTGKVMISGSYKDDYKDGYWMYFNEVGQAEKRLTYANDNVTMEEITVRGPDKKVAYLDIDKIAYIFNSGGKVTIRTREGLDLASERTIDEFLTIINEYKFYRVNANYIIALWSFTNRKTYSSTTRLLDLNPAASGQVYVADTYAEGFLHWAGLVKGEVDPKKPQN